MSSQTNDFKYESMQDCESIGNYLSSLCEGFSSKKIVLQSDSEEFTVAPHGLLKFEIKAKKKSDRVKLKLEISWRNGAAEEEGSGKLVIASQDND